MADLPAVAPGQLQTERRFEIISHMMYVLALVVALLLAVGVVSFIAKREARDLRGDDPRTGRRGDK